MINPPMTLRVFRKLDVERLSPEFIDKVQPEEGRVDYVDSSIPRDWAYTEEIIETTIGAAVVDEHGNIIKEFEGENAYALAEKARGSAKIVFSVDVEVPDGEPKKGRGRQAAAEAPATEDATE